MINFFRNRAIAGVEWVEDNSYQRLITYGDVHGWFKATHCQKNKIEIEFKLNKNSNILEFVARLKNIFDLDADPMAIENCLQEDPKLRPFLKQYSGLRVTGGWDGFELAVRAVIGQKISVKAARTILGRVVEICGTPQTLVNQLKPKLTHSFPTPEHILDADLSKIGLPGSKIDTLKALAQAVLNKILVLDGTADFEDTCLRLLSIKGIGPWTMEYIAMRALRNPNAFPHTDLELLKKISRLQLDPQKWIPWRAYGAALLWNLQLENNE